MTINQAHNYIKVELDKTSSLELPAFEQEEIDYWLDDSIIRFIKTRYSGTNVKGESFEQSQKRIDDLRTLVTESVLITAPGTAGSYTNSLVYNLPSDYLFSLREESSITYSGSTTRVAIHPITHDEVNVKLDDPYSSHNISFGSAIPLRLFVGSQIVLIGDGNYTINGVYMTYIKTPEKMTDVANRDAEYADLTDQAMGEVVKMAANSMIENIESQRYQTHSIELSKQE